MKKYLWVLAVFALSACDQGNSTSPSASNNNSTSISTGPSIVEVVKKFSLSLNPAEGTEIKVLEASSDNKYESGSTVRFTVDVKDESKELVAVKINERFVGAVSGNEYEAVMPNDNAVISTETRSLGDASIASVSDVVAEGLPTTAVEAYEVLKGTIQAESKFLKSATYDSTYESSGVLTNMKAEVGFNDVVKLSGRKLSYNSSAMTYFSGEERGIADGHYYKISEDTSTNSNSVKGELKTVVEDNKEELASWEIKESDAKVNASTAGFVSNLLARTFSEKSSESFITTQTSYCWTDVQVATEVDDSNKFYTLSLTAKYSSYSGKRFISLDVEIDGDNFVKSAVFAANDYNSDDVDSETNLPFEDAAPKSTKSIEIHQERNYRHTIEKTDINQFVTDDYDVLLSYQLPGQTEVDVGENMEVENTAKLMYRVRQKDVKKFMFLPNLVGAKEEDAITFDDGKPYLAKEGNVTLVFDNGLGTLKEVAIKSIKPKPSSVTTDLPNSLFSNEDYNFHVTISPSEANQDATVTLKEGSACKATITKNEDGSFTIRATTNGNGTLVVASSVDPTVKKEVSFTVTTKPNPDNVYTFLTSKTLHGKISGWGSHFVNLNSDGTGEYVSYDDKESGAVVPFTWEFDRATLAISVTVDETLKSRYYYFGGLFNATETSVELSVLYGTGRTEKGPVTLTALATKLDFHATDLDLSTY